MSLFGAYMSLLAFVASTALGRRPGPGPSGAVCLLRCVKFLGMSGLRGRRSDELPACGWPSGGRSSVRAGAPAR